MLDLPHFIELDESLIESSLSERLEAAARETPDALAVAGAAHRFAYAAFNHFANRIAREILRCLGAGTALQQIAVLLEHDAPVVAAVFGVFKSGHTCVVLDSGDPVARLRRVIADAEVSLVVTDRAGRDLASSLAGGRPVLEIDTRWAGERTPDLDTRVDPASAAMILYTSGSTGLPKGVVRSHRAFVSASINAVNLFQIGPNDRLSMFARLSTGQGATPPFTAFLSGASVHMLSLKQEGAVDLAAWLDAERISVYQSSATVLRYLARTMAPGHRLRHLRVVRIGGEQLRREDLEFGVRHLPAGCRFFNVYSMTESGSVLAQDLRELADIGTDAMPVGYPLPGRQVLITDDSGREVPAGEVGEIRIRSRHLADGYWRAPELTAGRFLPQQDGTVVMKTGDLGRIRPDGGVEFVGRRDLRVKVRGHRVEVAEVEAALLTYRGVTSAAVVLQSELGDPRLVAFYLCDESPSSADLRRHLRTLLPEQAVPSFFARVDAMPLTASGKIDRQALAVRALAHDKGEASLAGIDARLARHFADALGHSVFDRETDFFVVGGDSLRAAQVLSRVRDEFGVDLPFREFLTDPTIARLATSLSGEAAGARAHNLQPIVRRQDEGPAPLSFSQRQLWLIDRLSPGDPAYNVCRGVRLTGLLDVERLRGAIDALVARHAALRTTFAAGVDGPVQVVHAGRRPEFSLVDLGHLDAETQAGELARRLDAECDRPFDLERDVLMRAVVVRLSPLDHALLLVNHHIATDARSSGILRRELLALYGRTDERPAEVLPPIRVEYSDFAVWQREQLSEAAIEKDLAYWKARLADAPAHLPLPVDRARSADSRQLSGRQAVRWSQALVLKLERLARREQVTLFMLALAAFQTFLHRYSNADDIVVGSPVSGRLRPETENIVGFFANTVIFRTSLSGDPSFLEVIGRVRDVALGAYDHQALPFERVVEALRPVRVPGQAPIAQVFFGLYAFDGPPLGLPGLVGTPIELKAGSAKFDLTLSVSRRDEGVEGHVEYNASLFDAGTIARMMTHFETLLTGVADDPDRPISRLPLMSVAEQERAWAAASDDARPLPVAASLFDLFRAGVEFHPSATAVKWKDDSWSYQVLADRAGFIAARLSAAGLKAGERVGILMHPSPSLVASVVGVIAAGCVYVPLDPLHPPARWAHVLHDAGVRLVLASPGQVIDGIDTITVDEGGECEPRDGGPFGIASSRQPGDVACVLYTSGSTGTARGVEITHCGIARLVLNTNYVSVGANDVVALLATPAFDASTFEIWAPLLNGAAIAVMPRMAALAPRTFGDELGAAGATIAFLPTALFHRLADAAPESLTHVRELLVGGEAMDPSAAARALATPGCPRLVNAYGPTETTTFATWHVVEAADCAGPSVPIGRPISNTEVVILDRAMSVVPVGVIGEIYIGGPGLARGYLGLPDLTRERFVPHPRRPLDRLYRTGDRAFYRADGVIVFAGRVDDQIKIRGFRVEPAEVEAVLGRHPQVAQVAVVARTQPDGERCLAAYVVPPAGGVVQEAALRGFLRGALPDFMMPAAIVVLDALPVTSNGKIDRRLLPEPMVGHVERPWEAPSGALEERVAEVWRDAIGVSRVGRHDNFFEIGGHSLTAVHVIARLDRDLGVSIVPQAIFEYPTLSAFAARLAAAGRETAASPVRRRLPGQRPVPASLVQQQAWDRRLLRPADSGFMSVRTFDLHGEVNAHALGASLSRVVRRHEVLRTALRVERGELVQDVQPPCDIVVNDLDVSTAGDPQAASQVAVLAEVHRPFSFVSGPWLRATLIRLSPGRHRLVLSLPHVVYDAWSLDILYRELATFYGAAVRGRQTELPEPPLQYADYTLWESAEGGQARRARELTYWRGRLAGLAPRPLFVSRMGIVRRALRQATRARTVPLVSRGTIGAFVKQAERVARFSLSWGGARRSDLVEQSRLRLDVHEDVVEALRSCARAEGVSLFAAMSAALQVVLMHRTGDPDVVFATFTANRIRPEMHDVMGPLVNTLAIRMRLVEKLSFRDAARRTHQRIAEAQDHGALPFPEISAALTRPGELPIEHRIPIVFQLIESLRHAPELAGAQVRAERLVSRHRSPRLALTAMTEGRGIRATLTFDPAFYTSDAASRFLRDVDRVLAAAGRTPDADVARLAAELGPEPLRNSKSSHKYR